MALLFALMLLIQGIPLQQGGTVTGVLRDSAGMPLPGIRMAALARPDSVETITEGTAMAGIAETDIEGKFVLENVPPGKYVVAAGRLDLQTYYPGTQTFADATVVTIVPGATVSGINFVLKDTSFGRAANSLGSVGSIQTSIPVKVIVENGGKLPISSDGKFVSIRAESLSMRPVTIPIDTSFMSIPGPTTANFRVMLENLPDTYVVKSITYGSLDITRGTFRLTPSNFPQRTVVITSASAVTPPAGALPSTEAELRAYLDALAQLRLVSGIGGVAINTSQPSSSFAPPSTLTITLAQTAQPSVGGVLVSGQTGDTVKRLIYLSGRPGVLFSDGSFEFRSVPPGRHRIAAVSNPTNPLAAIIVVGDRDLDGIKLTETPLLPTDIRVPTDPLPANGYAPGSTVPLARLRGTVLEEVTRAPIPEGQVVVHAGSSTRMIPIESDGHFETVYLLPGTYDLKLQIFGHTTNTSTIVIDDKDLSVELTSRRLY